jgi:hypothetical protein
MRTRAMTAALVAIAAAATYQLPAASSFAALAERGENPHSSPDPAAVQLSDDYDVPYEEALRRVQRQDAVFGLADSLAAKLPDTFGSLYVDHSQGGSVVVNRVGADPRIADEVSKAGLSDVVRYRDVRHSSRELQAVFTALDRDLPAVQNDQSPLALSLDPVSHQVAVATTDATLTAEQQEWIEKAQARYGRALTRTHAGRGQASACAWPSCDAPLRGGLWISNTSTGSGACTSGFIAMSKTDTSRKFMITAGHCTGTSMYQKKSTTGSWVKVGTRHANSYWDSTGDAALYTVDSNLDWDPRGWVYVRQSTHTDPVLSTTENASYPIQSFGPAGTGAYVCHTGVTIGTRCGEVLSGTWTGTYGSKTVSNLARVRYTNCEGDSGGPVYRANKAHGIHVAFEAPAGAGTKTAPNGVTSVCSYIGWYHHITPILTKLNVNLLAG